MGAKSDSLFGRSQSASDNLRIWQIKFLEDISIAVGGGGGPALATEGTLISVLNAIVASDQDIEILLVRDEAVGNGDPVLKQVTNYQTGTPVITYENVDGTTYVPSPNPTPVYVYLDPSSVLQLILAELVLLNAGGQLALDATVLATNILLTAIDGVLDNILLDTTAILSDTNTLSTPDTGLATSLLVVSAPGAASVTAGKRRVSFMNTGNADTTVAGATLKRGLSITFSADGLRDTLAAISYNALTSELTITTVG